MIDDITIEDKINVYFKKGIAVHIIKKENGWLNGYIDELGSLFFILNEFKYGKLIVFYSEIDKVETYTKEIKDGTQNI